MKRHVLTLLLLTTAALVLVLAFLWLAPDGSLRNVRWEPPVPVTSDYLQMLPVLPERSRVDTSRFMALLERPLFSLTRRPPPPAPPPVAEVPPDNLSTARLSGIFTGAGTGGAIIHIAGKNRRVRLNESVDGWVLQAIQGRSVTFASGGQTRVLQLPRAALSTYSGQALPADTPPAAVVTPLSQPASGAGAAGAAPNVPPTTPRKSRFGP